MDGYAVRAAEIAEVPVEMSVTQRIPAGHAGSPLQPGSVARIFTGAALPVGADAVVMQENAETDDLHSERVTILQTATAGENVRQKGEDIRKGAVLFAAGHRLTIPDMNVLSASGIAELSVRERLRVAVITTGDELVRPGTSLKPGQIYNSNFYILAALLERLGMQVIDLGVVGDQFDATVEGLDAASRQADCIITSGGVSVGEEDHVKAAVEKLGKIALWKLAVKPGKPFAFGQVNEVPFFGLPGNPVSAFVTFVLLVRPALLKLAGATSSMPAGLRLPVDFSASSTERQEFLRVKLKFDEQGMGRLDLFRNQSSGAGSSLSDADGLAILPPFTTVKHGDMLEFISLGQLME